MDPTPLPPSSSTRVPPQPPLNLFLLLLLLLLHSSFPLLSLAAFDPADKYLLACGAAAPAAADDGRLFVPDSSADPVSFSVRHSSALSSPSPSSLSPLLRSARLFRRSSSYSFPLSPSSSAGGLLLRLHFLPFPHPSFNLSSALFSVEAAGSLLLRHWHPPFLSPSPAPSPIPPPAPSSPFPGTGAPLLFPLPGAPPLLPLPGPGLLCQDQGVGRRPGPERKRRGRRRGGKGEEIGAARRRKERGSAGAREGRGRGGVRDGAGEGGGKGGCRCKGRERRARGGGGERWGGTALHETGRARHPVL